MPEEPADTMRERSQRSTAWAYVLFDADRKIVAGGLLIGVFFGLVGFAALFPGPAAALRSGDAVETVFQPFIGTTITVVTLVLTFNQFVLSQELGAAGDQRERMEGALEFRDDTADVLGDPVSPAEPSAFPRALVDLAVERARAVRDAVDEPDGELEDATFGEFDVVSAALDFNYSWKLYAARRSLSNLGGDDPAAEPLEDLAEALQLFGPAREHFKTLYFQSELTSLSGASSSGFRSPVVREARPPRRRLDGHSSDDDPAPSAAGRSSVIVTA